MSQIYCISENIVFAHDICVSVSITLLTHSKHVICINITILIVYLFVRTTIIFCATSYTDLKMNWPIFQIVIEDSSFAWRVLVCYNIHVHI